MKKIGIVCEFNPFHKGHEYLIAETRKMFAEEVCVICVMSGDFVQRGEPAIYQKSARAEAACRGGANLVVELPTAWSLASAERFAEGAVSILGNLGAEYIAFGSECGDVSALQELAAVLMRNETVDEIKKLLSADANMSFAAARERVMEKLVGEKALLLESPNNILAVEYLKAIIKHELSMQPLTVKRKGSGHDENGESEFRSSSELRRLMLKGEDVSEYIPEAVLEVYNNEDEKGNGRISSHSLEQAIISRLRMLPETAFDRLPDSGGGAGKRLYKSVCLEGTLDGIYEMTKTKRYAMSRIRRMSMCAALGIKAEDSEKTPPYARILAADRIGCSVLREQSDKGLYPIITKPAAVRSLSDEINKVFANGVYAHDLYVLGNTCREARKAGQDWKNSPKIVQN